jgi:hypothetical protein
MPIDPITQAGTRAKGKRPAYFDDPAIDRVLSITMAVAGEVAVLRERLDSIERLLDEKGTISREDIEAFTPDREGAYERGLWHRDYAARILRGVQQDMEALDDLDPPLEAVAEELRVI